MIKLLIGGSPCTFWSVAQRKHRETEPNGMGWELFKNYLLAREKFSPDLRFETHCEPKANAITTVQTDSMVAIESGAKHEKPCYEVKDGKIEIKGRTYAIRLPDGFYTIRKLTPIECERLQTMPDNYTAAVSASQRYKALGNGWTAVANSNYDDIIQHGDAFDLRRSDWRIEP